MADREKTASLTPLTLAIVAVATPAALALSLYSITGDARWRPLAQTVETKWLHDIERKPLTAVIYWPIDRDAAGGEVLAERVRKSIRAKGVHAKVSVVGVEGDGYVIYRVGHNRIGPFKFPDAALGIDGAVAAYWRQASEDGPDAG